MMAEIASISSISPGEVDQEVAARALRRIKDYLANDSEESDTVRVLVEGSGDDVLVLPRAAVTMFAHILAQAAQGRGVAVIPSRAELSTQQAADMLNVSRPHLIGLLESGKIPFRKVGRHRRVTSDDLLGYMRQDDSERRAAADDLAEVSQELGLY